MKVCKQCNTPIINGRIDKIYCSANCRALHWGRNHINRYYNKLLECRICHRYYIPSTRNPRRKYCSGKCVKYKLCINSKNYRIRNHSTFLLGLKSYRDSPKGKTKRCFLQIQRQRRLKGLKEGFTINQWLDKLNKTKGYCNKCNKLIGVSNLTKDHNPPVTKAPEGYTYSIDDVIPLCISCNSSKGNRL